MDFLKSKFASLTFVLILVLSISCSGFLVGRTVALHKSGKWEQMQQVSEQVVDAGTFIQRGMEVVKRIVLR